MLKPSRVEAVACGRHHTVMALDNGKLMAVGSNSEGQLGVGRHPEWTSVPMPVQGEQRLYNSLQPKKQLANRLGD